MSQRSSTARSTKRVSGAKKQGRVPATPRNEMAPRGWLHLDAFSGAAGNMLLGALLDAGLSRRELERELGGLGVAHRLRVRSVRRGALGALYLDVCVPAAGSRGPRWVSADETLGLAGESHRDTRARHAHGSQSGSARDHDHVHSHEHEATHAQAAPRARKDAHPSGAHATRPHGARARANTGAVVATRAHGHGGRSFASIRRQLLGAKLAPEVRARAIEIFEALARAEARVHRSTIDAVHFHEVGAVDALVDITGAAIALTLLGVDGVSCSPIALGHGMVEMQHGCLPLPAPATLELLRGVPTVPAHVGFETVTPTGAAILRCLVGEFGAMPALTPLSIGHGAGRDRPGPVPNVLRAILGRREGWLRDRVVSLEANLDDLVPEQFEFVMERLLEAGALDVSLVHAQMKKNRPGFWLRVLARPQDRVALSHSIARETGTLGVRAVELDRLVLERESLRVPTAFGVIRVKRSRDPEGHVEVSAEYDDCRRAARRSGAPLREVVRSAEDAARSRS